jgi:hypothetical protein
MAEPTLTQIFGANATQSSSTLTISKTDLAAVGLTPSTSNTAESLWVSLLLLAKAQLTGANQETNPEQSITIEDSFESLVTRNNQRYRQKTMSVNLEKLDTGAGIDPDDY